MTITFLCRTLSLTEVVLSLVLNKGDNSSWEQQSQERLLVSFCSCTWPVYVQPKGINRETIEGINRLSFQQGSCAKEMTLLALFTLKDLFHSETGTKAPNSFLRPHFLLWRGGGFNFRSRYFRVYPEESNHFFHLLFAAHRERQGFCDKFMSHHVLSNYRILTLNIIW